MIIDQLFTRPIFEAADPSRLIVSITIQPMSTGGEPMQKEIDLTGQFQGSTASQMNQAMDYMSKMLESKGLAFNDLQVHYQGHTITGQNRGAMAPQSDWEKEAEAKAAQMRAQRKAATPALKEFAPSDDDSNGSDPEELLRRMASYWWNGNERQMAKVENTLAAMGWEIGQDDGYDDGGVFVVRAGDEHGGSYISWPHEDLELNEGRKKKKKKISRSLGRYFFPGYGYYGSGESGEGGGDGGGGESANPSMAEGSDQQLSIRHLATISDEALDKAYGYGRSSPGNTFGWQANLKSAAYAKHMIDKGVTDIDEIADAIHKGWNVTAKAFVKNPNRFDDTEKLKAAGKLEAKLQQRAKLMNIDYSQLPDDEQEKDRVVARALLQAITGGGEQNMSEGEYDSRKPFGVRYKVFAGREGRLTTREYYTSSEEKLQRAVDKIQALDNFYEIDGYSYPKESQGVAEGRRTGEYSRVVRALGLYYPDKFSMEELNTPDWHRVIAYKADVPVEYAGKVINDFTRPYDYNDEQDVTEGMESFGDEYLRKAADPNRFGRFLISVEQAQAELDARAQGKQQAPPPAPLTPPAKSQGFSKEYLQGVVNGTHPRPLITKEKAQELLNQMNENIDPLMNKLRRAMVQEGRVKELADDLKTMADADFMKKYGKAKAAIRADMKRVDETRSDYTAAEMADMLSGKRSQKQVDADAERTRGPNKAPTTKESTQSRAKRLNEKLTTSDTLATGAGISRFGKKDIEPEFNFRTGLVGDDQTDYETQNEPELGMFRMGKPVEPNDAATNAFISALTPSQQDNRFTAPAGWRYVEKDEDPARYGSGPAAATSALPNLIYDPQSRTLKSADTPALDLSPKSKYKFDRTTQSQVPADGSGANRNIDAATRDRALAYAAQQNAPAAAAKQKVDWKTIYALNKATIGSNPNVIRPRMQLNMPNGTIYMVQPGDTLTKIAAKQNQVNELSTEKLAQYKTAAARDAREADQAGDFKRGDKRFGGIVKATKKQFDNDDKKVDESRAARRALMARIVNHR